MNDENNQQQGSPLNQDPYQDPLPSENKAPENIFSEKNSIDSSEKTPRVYKLWHLIAALGLGSILTASAFLLPSFGGQGFIGGQLPAVDNISPSTDFSLFTGALTPGLSNFTGELTPELSNLTIPLVEPNIIKLDPADLEKVSIPTTTPIIPETIAPVTDFEDIPVHTVTNPVILSPVSPVSQPTTTTTTTTTVSEPATVPQYTIVQPTETTITNPVTVPQTTIVQPVVEYKNIPIPTNYTLKTIQ